MNVKIDEYIESRENFAQPILKEIRKRVLLSFPQLVEELKWGFPHYTYRKQIVCSMAAFKNHCAFGFFKEALMQDPYKIFNSDNRQGMGSLGKITAIDQLPEQYVFTEYILEVIALIDSGVKGKSTTKNRNRELLVPDDFLKALAVNDVALSFFNTSSYSCKKEYIDWIISAKTETTRNKRILQAVEMLADKKNKNYKYERK